MQLLDILGITATRNGMSDEQVISLTKVFLRHRWAEFHHGDCVGGDDEAANLFYELCCKNFTGDERAKIVAHPPIIEDYRAHNQWADVTQPARPYLSRNRNIVHSVGHLIVVPKHSAWRASGGTWYTHDYAMKHRVSMTVILPNGTLLEIE